MAKRKQLNINISLDEATFEALARVAKATRLKPSEYGALVLSRLSEFKQESGTIHCRFTKWTRIPTEASLDCPISYQ